MSFNMQHNYFLKAVNEGDTSSGAVALTFDDGPVAGNTEKILDILKQKNISATFFCIGHRVEANPELVKRMHAEGHIVGNHSFVHGKLFSLQSAHKMVKELTQTDAVITNLTRKKPTYFRPPYGVTNPNVAVAVTHTAHKTIGWNVRSLDTVTRKKETLWKRITKSVKPGDIILFHDTSALTIEVLPAYIDHLTKSGLKIAPLDELINQQAYA
jgi:peptidoglycan-N-acetylglucosamine deacetylase